MKFYSHSNINSNYTKAISLANVRSVERTTGAGASKIRFGVVIKYCDGKQETFELLHEEESKTVHKEIIDLLNK